MKKTLVAGMLAVAALGVAAISAQTAPAAPAAKDQMMAKSIAQIVATDPNFSTLLAAVTAADLVKTLSGEGPFTVFAPTNAAFAKIPKADLAKLLADKAALTKVLTYHVVPAKVMAADVVKLKDAKTAEGSAVTIMVKDGAVILNGDSKVTQTDIAASNGVIHVIDTVIMPKMMK
jgi:uncharacterized surface protein with fasciclin (FAS1) repeats